VIRGRDFKASSTAAASTARKEENAGKKHAAAASPRSRRTCNFVAPGKKRRGERGGRHGRRGPCALRCWPIRTRTRSSCAPDPGSLARGGGGHGWRVHIASMTPGDRGSDELPPEGRSLFFKNPPVRGRPRAAGLHRPRPHTTASRSADCARLRGKWPLWMVGTGDAASPPPPPTRGAAAADG